MSRLIVVCLVLAPLAACLQPAAGDTCNPEDSAACASTSVALYCVGGSFQAVPCTRYFRSISTPIVIA